MTIERKENPVFKFEELTPGTVFEYEGEIYMKTVYTRERGISAVELQYGCLSQLTKDTLVKRLNAKLTVTE